MSGPRLLLLIRHARSDQASGDMFEGPRGSQWDPPLDEVGRDQAELLTRRLLLMDPRPSAVYCSTLRRARETIAPYAERSGARVVYDEELVEAYIGEWENKSFEEIISSDDRMLHRIRNQDAIWRHAPGAETIEQLRDRIGAAVERILERHPEGNVAIVAHGGVINAYVGRLLDIRQEMFFLPENTSVNSVDVDGEERRVRFLNDDRHLAEPHLFEERGG